MASRRMVHVFLSVLVWSGAAGASATEPWVITSPVTLSEPAEIGDVIVAGDGVLRVEDVGEPGVRFSGNVVALDGGRVVFEDSVIRFMSVYHGQYALIAWRGGEVTVRRCDYRVPSGVQHGIFAGEDGRIDLEDGDFGFVQLVPTGDSVFEARRLDGVFEVVVQNRASLLLEDIPRTAGAGELWIWPEFPEGSVATYTPPPPGFVTAWEFPPPDSSGIAQTITLRRCMVKLWPMLVRAGCELTLADIAADNWVVVGLHLPGDLEIKGLRNQDPETTRTLPLADRTIRLENASIDTWNLYPEADARIDVRDSVLGEILAFARSRVHVKDSVIDGTGGFLGAAETSVVTLDRSTVTCDLQATGESTVTLRECTVAPPDVPGFVMRLGAYDSARLLLAQTTVEGVDEGRLVTAIGGRGVIGVAVLDPTPSIVPGPGGTVDLRGWAALYAADPTVAGTRWTLEGRPACGLGDPEELASGEGPIEGGLIGRWTGTADVRSWRLELRLTDGLGRSMTARWTIPGRIAGGCARPGRERTALR